MISHNVNVPMLCVCVCVHAGVFCTYMHAYSMVCMRLCVCVCESVRVM